MNIKTFKNVIKLIRSRGIKGAFLTVYRLKFPPKCRIFQQCAALVKNRYGLEIGGPSSCFEKGFMPIYSEIARLDNCNFSNNTVWEGALTEGLHFKFNPDKPNGYQYICEATDLSAVPENSYDFVISHHALEHVANPLKAMQQWLRILKGDGIAILILPHKAQMFDRRRPVTTLSHLIEDYSNNTGEDDATHLSEILELHDINLDWSAESLEAFQQQCRQNAKFRCIHHHVFTTELVIGMFDFIGMQVLMAESQVQSSVIVVAQKCLKPDNQPFLSLDAAWRKNSPFAIDRQRSSSSERKAG
jgi:SAM-dependent methyltransferase